MVNKRKSQKNYILTFHALNNRLSQNDFVFPNFFHRVATSENQVEGYGMFLQSMQCHVTNMTIKYVKCLIINFENKNKKSIVHL